MMISKQENEYHFHVLRIQRNFFDYELYLNLIFIPNEQNDKYPGETFSLGILVLY